MLARFCELMCEVLLLLLLLFALWVEVVINSIGSNKVSGAAAHYGSKSRDRFRIIMIFRLLCLLFG